MYSGTIHFSNNFKTNVDLLIAADELRLEDLCSHTIEELFKDKKSLESNFVLIQCTVRKLEHYTKLSQLYQDSIQQDPSLIFNTDDFITKDRSFLLDILKKNHSLKPDKVWDKLVEWCRAQSVELKLDVGKWTPDDVSTFRDLIHPFIQYINFKDICSTDFSQKVKPFFDDEFCIKILGNRSLMIDSKIINSEQAFLLADFIKMMRKDTRNDFYKFELLIRATDQGFGNDPFYESCEEKGPTITVARVKDTNEILGGFNSLKWKSYSHNFCSTKNFIFSLDVNNLEDSIFSKVKVLGKTTRNKFYLLPDFGDLYFEINDTKKGLYRKNIYEKSIRKNQGEFEIDDYEVFQVHYQ